MQRPLSQQPARPPAALAGHPGCAGGAAPGCKPASRARPARARRPRGPCGVHGLWQLPQRCTATELRSVRAACACLRQGGALLWHTHVPVSAWGAAWMRRRRQMMNGARPDAQAPAAAMLKGGAPLHTNRTLLRQTPGPPPSRRAGIPTCAGLEQQPAGRRATRVCVGLRPQEPDTPQLGWWVGGAGPLQRHNNVICWQTAGAHGTCGVLQHGTGR